MQVISAFVFAMPGYIDSIIYLLPESEISSIYPSSEAVQPGM